MRLRCVALLLRCYVTLPFDGIVYVVACCVVTLFTFAFAHGQFVYSVRLFPLVLLRSCHVPHVPRSRYHVTFVAFVRLPRWFCLRLVFYCWRYDSLMLFLALLLLIITLTRTHAYAFVLRLFRYLRCCAFVYKTLYVTIYDLIVVPVTFLRFVGRYSCYYSFDVCSDLLLHVVRYRCSFFFLRFVVLCVVPLLPVEHTHTALRTAPHTHTAGTPHTRTLHTHTDIQQHHTNALLACPRGARILSSRILAFTQTTTLPTVPLLLQHLSAVGMRRTPRLSAYHLPAILLSFCTYASLPTCHYSTACITRAQRVLRNH